MKIDLHFHVASKSAGAPEPVVRAFRLARLLNKLKPIERGGTHIAGLLAELIAEHCYGMKPAPRGTQGYDCTNRKGERVQVKGFSHKKRGPSFRSSGEDLTAMFDRLLVLHVTERGWRVTCNRTAEDIAPLVIETARGGVRLQNYFLT